MSRCFPFPPPGYERKHIADDLDLLNEAKRKEKKHKKDKKDKRKDKEKDNDRGDDKEKHKDKKDKDRKSKSKDKKEKHRERKKDKDKGDRSKDKDKSSISEESTIAGKVDKGSEGKLRPTKVSSTNERAIFSQSSSQLPYQVIDDSKFVQELDRRIRDVENGNGSQLPDKGAVFDKRDQEAATARNTSGISHREYPGNALIHNLTPMSSTKVGGVPVHRPPGEQNGRRLEDNDKYKEISNIKQKHHHDKAKSEIKRSDPGKSKEENGTRNDVGGVASSLSTNLLHTADNNSLNEAKIQKRKEVMGTNGFLHENEMIRPQKMQKLVPLHSTGNGTKLEAFQSPSKPSPNTRAIPNSNTIRMDKLANGITEAKKPFLSKSNPPVVSNQITGPPNIPLHQNSSSLKKALNKMPKIEDQIGEASRKPPHPDSKYLAEVLTVPKMTDWSENDDQDWLFPKKTPSKSTGKTMAKEDQRHVWSEAVHIESADICALPYVIPY